MPVRLWECPNCGHNERTLSHTGPFPPQCGCDGDPKEDIHYTYMEEVFTAPNTKMMETIDADKGKSRLKDQMKILKERSRNHARDHEADELISLNRDNGIERSGFVRKDGKKRTKIDDL